MHGLTRDASPLDFMSHVIVEKPACDPDNGGNQHPEEGKCDDGVERDLIHNVEAAVR